MSIERIGVAARFSDAVIFNNVAHFVEVAPPASSALSSLDMHQLEFNYKYFIELRIPAWAFWLENTTKIHEGLSSNFPRPRPPFHSSLDIFSTDLIEGKYQQIIFFWQYIYIYILLFIYPILWRM